MALPSNVSFGTVIGRFMRAVADGPDSDRNPDGIPMEGLTVRFIPSVDQFKNVTAGPPVTIIADPITATTDDEGYVVGDDGVRGVRLLATDDEDLQPTGWTWGVAISGTGFRTISFSFALPADDGTEESATDLTDVIRVPSNPGGALADWVAAVEATQAAAGAAGAAAIVAVDAADRAEAIPASSDALMASNLDIPGGEFATKLSASFEGFDVPRTAALLPNANAVFIAAATAAQAAGRTVLRVAPGTYNAPSLHPDDIQGLKIVGDGVTLTGPAWVYPFTTSEFADRSAQATSGVVGRGVIAFEVDDSQESHWSSLFPLSKELGVPFGSSWIVTGAPWMKEAVRHGWEAIGHFTRDVQIPTLTEAEMVTEAIVTLDALEDVTGTRDGHGMVYPQHVRTEESDRVMSQYFARARGASGRNSYARNAPNPWLYTAYDMDGHIGDGDLSVEMRHVLQSIAASDGRMVFLSHWRVTGAELRSAGLRKMIAYARNLGIDIRTPKQLMTRSQIMGYQYVADHPGAYTLIGATAVLSSEQAYHGLQSVKAGDGANVTVQGLNVYPAARAGCFTVIRPSVRVKTTGATASAAGGLFFRLQAAHRESSGLVSGNSVPIQMQPKLRAGVIPALDWERQRKAYFLPPDVAVLLPSWRKENVTGGDLYLDEFQIDVIDYVPEFTVEGVTAGTDPTLELAAASVYPGAIGLDRCRLEVVAVDAFAGTPTAYLMGSNTAVGVKSTDVADKNKKWRVRVRPGVSYTTTAWPTTGA